MCIQYIRFDAVNLAWFVLNTHNITKMSHVFAFRFVSTLVYLCGVAMFWDFFIPVFGYLYTM